jgi:hypothetical protein
MDFLKGIIPNGSSFEKKPKHFDPKVNLNNQNAAFREQIENVTNQVTNIRKEFKNKKLKSLPGNVTNLETKLKIVDM